jgi:hypothetical protein
MTSPIKRQIKGFVAEMGGTVTELIAGKHWKVRADFNGIPIQFTYPRSPSDWRAEQNRRSEIRSRVRAAEQARK